MKIKFWEIKDLNQLNQEQWESLCDRCGKCCLNKIIDDATNKLYYTDAVCKLMDVDTGCCSNYDNRFEQVPDCMQIKPDNLNKLDWLPPTCAYLRLYQNRNIPSWHPLLNKNDKKMHKLGYSIIGKVINEEEVEDLQEHLVQWPLYDCE